MTGKWALRLGLFILFVGDALVDEGGRNLLRILIYFSTDFFFHTSKKAAIRMPMGHVEFSWHSFFFLCAPSPLVFSLCASGPTDGLPTAFWCIRCHSFYLSVTLLTDECGPFLLLSVLYRISFASPCGYIGVGSN